MLKKIFYIDYMETKKKKFFYGFFPLFYDNEYNLQNQINKENLNNLKFSENLRHYMSHKCEFTKDLISKSENDNEFRSNKNRNRFCYCNSEYNNFSSFQLLQDIWTAIFNS